MFPYLDPWEKIPTYGVCFFLGIVAAVLAAYSPAKRMRTISVTETINEL